MCMKFECPLECRKDINNDYYWDDEKESWILCEHEEDE